MTALARNNVTVTGSGNRVIVFAHGFGGDQVAWNAVAPAFEQDWTVVRFDHVGAGGSDLRAFDKGKYSSLDGFASDLLEILEELNVSRVTYVGHSMGAMIGIVAANRSPERFAELIMLCPSPRYIDGDGYVGGFSARDIDEMMDVIASNFLGWSQVMGRNVMGNEERPHLGDEMVISFRRMDPDVARHWANAIFRGDYREAVLCCKHRSLVLQTNADAVAPVEVGEWMHKSLPASEYRLMEATGHYPHISAPLETISAIRQFVAA